MTKYHARWHAEHALDLLRAIEDWDETSERYRRAAVVTARRRLEKALEADVGALDAPDPEPSPAAADAPATEVDSD